MSNYGSEKEANVWTIILSVLIPLVGYVLYFVKKEEQSDAAKNYLLPAIVGSVVFALLYLG